MSSIQHTFKEYFHRGIDFFYSQKSDLTNYVSNELDQNQSFFVRHPLLSTAGRIVSLACVNTVFLAIAMEINKNLTKNLSDRNFVNITKNFVTFAFPATFTVLTAKVFSLAITPLQTVVLSVISTSVILLLNLRTR